MKKVLKERWVKALREGEYEQGRKFLRRHDRYCCLGVLCDLSPVGEWDQLTPARGTVSFVCGGVYADNIPPVAVLDEVGLSTGLAHDLASLNDGGADFSEIATVIEESVPVD